MTTTDHTKTGLEEKLSYLKLSFMRDNSESLAKKAAQKLLGRKIKNLYFF